MAKHYSPKQFFRKSPNWLLQRYFERQNVLYEIDFSKISEAKIDPLYEAWLSLPDSARKEMEHDFQEINDMSTEGGTKAILDEARWHDEELSGQFASLESFYERAFWTFLERPKYWQGACAFNHADSLPTSYWRRRKNLPRKAADVSRAALGNFEKALSEFFHTTQGRGNNCKVDCYKRGDFDYFFAFPEDYAQASVEWEGKEFKRRPHHPAFEIIFVYSQAGGTLDIYFRGEKQTTPELQSIFAQTILGEKIGEDQKDERVYDLNRLWSRHFQFVYDSDSGIANVALKKLRLKILGTNERVTLEADPTDNKQALFDLLDKATKNVPNMQFTIIQVGIKVTFHQNPSSRKSATRSFDVGWPNSCSLKHEGRDLVIRKMLIESGVEPKESGQLEVAAA